MINLDGLPTQPQTVTKQERQTPPTPQKGFIDFGIGLMNPPKEDNRVLVRTLHGVEVVKAEENKEAGIFDSLFVLARRNMHGFL